MALQRKLHVEVKIRKVGRILCQLSNAIRLLLVRLGDCRYARALLHGQGLSEASAMS